MVDPANTTLGKMLMKEITPVVMVLCTPLVEQACKKNGLNFVDMLSPFSVFDKIDVPVRTASDQPYRLQKFKLRLFYASDIRKPEFEAARARLNKVVTGTADKENSDNCLELHDNENIAASKLCSSLVSGMPDIKKVLPHGMEVGTRF